MRKVMKPVQVVIQGNRHPERFYWRRRWLRVLAVVDEWREIGAWWDGEGEKRFVSVLADNGGLYELCCDERKEWRLTRISD